jgi:hypothetical protein
MEETRCGDDGKTGIHKERGLTLNGRGVSTEDLIRRVQILLSVMPVISTNFTPFSDYFYPFLVPFYAWAFLYRN